MKVKQTLPNAVAWPNRRYSMSEGARRLGAWHRLERLRLQYFLSHNPRFAFAAHSVARDFGVEIPEWVLSYLDVVDVNLGHTGAGKRLRKGHIAQRVMEALGFTAKGADHYLQEWLDTRSEGRTDRRRRDKTAVGRFNVFASTDKHHRDVNIVERVILAEIDFAGAEKTSTGTFDGGLKARKARRAKAIRWVGHDLGVSVGTIRNALAAYVEVTPVRRVADDLQLCLDSGMTRGQATKAIAEVRGFPVAWARPHVRRFLRNN